MMKKVALIFFLFFLSHHLIAQNLVAQYDVKRTVTGTPKELDIPPLNLTCYYYKKGNRAISFLKADYLKDYPNAVLSVDQPGQKNYNFFLNSDSIQGISYFDMDSLLLRTHSGEPGAYDENRYYNYAKDYRQWQMLNETQIIHGMHCKLARLFGTNGTPIAEIWYNPEIEMPVAMRNLMNLPGLIVQATYF